MSEQSKLWITIDMAKEISVKSGYPEIVVFGYDPESGMQHVTTFGKTKKQCVDAARAGNYLKRSLGWPEKDCHAKPDSKVLESKPD